MSSNNEITGKLQSWLSFVGTKTSIFHFCSSHGLVTALMRLWHDLLRQPESGLFFFLSVPFLRRPRSHSRLSSVPMNTDIGHRLRPIAFAITASPSFFFSSLSCWCSLLGMQQSDCRAGQSYTDEKWGCILPLVCLFVSSVFPVPPSPPSVAPFPSSPPSHVSGRR